MGKITKSACLVTGGTGFIGSHVVSELVDLGNDVTVIDIQHNPRSVFSLKKLDKKTNFQNIDIRNREKLREIIKQRRPQYIFHLAAQAIVDIAYTDPIKTLDTNILGTACVLEEARNSPDLASVVVASSDKAYGKKDEKYVEGDALRGDHPYEVSKSATDLVSHSYFKTYGLPVVVTRFGNVYGEGDLNFSRIIPGIMEALVGNETLLLRSDGTYIRDYLYVKDVARGYIDLAANTDKTAGEAFNFGSHETLSVVSLIEKVQTILGRTVTYKIQNSAKNEIPSQSLDFSKVTACIGWKPLWSLEKTIPHIFDYYQSIL